MTVEVIISVAIPLSFSLILSTTGAEVGVDPTELSTEVEVGLKVGSEIMEEVDADEEEGASPNTPLELAGATTADDDDEDEGASPNTPLELAAAEGIEVDSGDINVAVDEETKTDVADPDSEDDVLEAIELDSDDPVVVDAGSKGIKVELDPEMNSIVEVEEFEIAVPFVATGTTADEVIETVSFETG